MIGVLHHASFRAMGTSCTLSVTATDADRRHARRALDAGLAEVEACESALSRFDPSSDLSRLNSAAGDWVDVDPRLAGALRLALRGREATNGRFDPTILPALVAAGYDRSFEELDERPALAAPGWRAAAEIEVAADGDRARLERGAAVDLGGIGKGFSADRAVRAMIAAWPSMPGCLVDLGGDVAVWGEPPDWGTWRIAVADPRHGGSRLSVLSLSAGGVATSGRDRRRFGLDGELHHLIDPATGEPAVPGPLAVTVVAPDAASAEAHATALAITPVAEASRYVAARPHISALVVPADGAPFMAGNLPAGVPAWAQDVAS
jgi:thiamine biosynthesis lipoprotein